jgi:hypothetical protein
MIQEFKMTCRAELREQQARREASEWLEEQANAIEDFELEAESSACYRAGKFDVTEHVDSVFKGLSARTFVHRPTSIFAYREWFLKRPGRRVLKLPCHDHPTNAREVAKLLLAGDERVVTGSYLFNGDVDSNAYGCFRVWDLLQDKTLRELEKEIASSKQFLRCCRVRHLKAALKRYAKFREREGLEIKINAKSWKGGIFPMVEQLFSEQLSQ